MVLAKSTGVTFSNETRSNSPVVKLSPCFEATCLGLIVTGIPPIDEWRDVGRKLKADEISTTKWWIGDWLNCSSKRYGEIYRQALEEMDYDYHSLRNMKSVSSRVAIHRRRTLLSWSHHAAVASLGPIEQDEWLDRAEEEDWTTATLNHAIKESKSLEYPPQPTSGDVCGVGQLSFDLTHTPTIGGNSVQTFSLAQLLDTKQSAPAKIKRRQLYKDGPRVCIYVVRNDDQILYIGSTGKYAWSRLKQHISDKSPLGQAIENGGPQSDQWQVDVYPMPDRKTAYREETRMQYHYRPTFR